MSEAVKEERNGFLGPKYELDCDCNNNSNYQES
jgi:hypothetical protein